MEMHRWVPDDHPGPGPNRTVTPDEAVAGEQIGIDFPDGDCRNDGIRNVVTDAQVQSLITEFDTNIRPKEATRFSTAPAPSSASSSISQNREGAFGRPNACRPSRADA